MGCKPNGRYSRNHKCKENSKFERDMIPFLYHVKSVNGTHYKESEINQTLRMKIGDNNTLILYDIGCGDSYGLENKKQPFDIYAGLL